MAHQGKVVWILGAGFSAGLGGPLLPSLLSRTLQQDIAVRYPDRAANPGGRSWGDLHTRAANNVRSLYEYGLSDPRLRSPDCQQHHQESLWAHAEEFLDYVDTAAEQVASQDANSDKCRATRLTEILSNKLQAKVSPSAIRAAARRLIAAECCAFLEDFSPGSERVLPYMRWIKHLIAPGDTIVSFNYDRLVEILDAANGARVVHTWLPNTDDADEPGVATLLKLHGSVDWKKDPRGYIRKDDPRFAMFGGDRELAIATPGPGKLSESSQTFRGLWTRAGQELSTADAIVFIGYRFPETDAHARGELLQKIGANTVDAGTGERKLLPIHVVLGNSTDSERHSARLSSLLEFVCRAAGRVTTSAGGAPTVSCPYFSISRHPLFAQDFLSVVRRKDLLG
jgi:hypothetical protein